MEISNAGFQDFRQDATCLIRPQSLLGEKYVDCSRPSLAAPGSPAAASVAVDPRSQPGAGQHFCRSRTTARTVDLDLVNNIMQEPFADRFRLILNDLGAGRAPLAARTWRRSSSAPIPRCARPTWCSPSWHARTGS